MSNEPEKNSTNYLQQAVRDRYGRIARGGDKTSSCCSGSNTPSCCGGPTNTSSSDYIEKIGNHIGYSDSDLRGIPEGANLGLGCGNPLALASLIPGSVVLDLGSGAGMDAFLAAKRVGVTGRVIGVDMTPEMVERARNIATKGGYENIEFRLGFIEELPVSDSCIDMVISNCVINLSPNKASVFREAFRVLKPGGMLMVSDIVLQKPLPPVLQNSLSAYTACIGGAILEDDYLDHITSAGFEGVEILQRNTFPIDLDELVKTGLALEDLVDQDGKSDAEVDMEKTKDAIASIKVSALKPL